jgi:hypothetical protein
VLGFLDLRRNNKPTLLLGKETLRFAQRTQPLSAGSRTHFGEEINLDFALARPPSTRSGTRCGEARGRKRSPHRASLRGPSNSYELKESNSTVRFSKRAEEENRTPVYGATDRRSTIKLHPPVQILKMDGIKRFSGALELFQSEAFDL